MHAHISSTSRILCLLAMFWIAGIAAGAWGAAADCPAWDVALGQPGPPVNALSAVVVHHGQLYAAGQPAGVFRWHRSSMQWKPVEWSGSGPDIHALAVHDGHLIAGGSFQIAVKDEPPIVNIARWDGEVWHRIGPEEQTLSNVRSLTTYNGDLIAGLQSGGVRRFDGQQWQQIGNITGTVYAMTVWNGNLVVGGSLFMQPPFQTGKVARWNGAWWWVGGDMNGSVFALDVHEGKLVAGGWFSASGAVYLGGIGRWDGWSWSGYDLGFSFGEGAGRVLATAIFDGELIAAGTFDCSGDQPLANIARWDGTAWNPLAGGISSLAQVRDLVIDGQSLVAAGLFSSADGQPAHSIAQWTCDPAGPLCVADLNADGSVDVLDLLMLLDSWGSCSKGALPGACHGDLNRDEVVDVLDLLLLLDAWGECP
jgi:hypothetical protein